MRRIPVMLIATLIAMPLAADTLLLESGTRQVGLLELYTSEGCSSCPPADRWLRSLVGRPGLFTEFVPLAFHVDYWDYIGWKDRFARPEYGGRQRRYARLGRVGTVYTPGFFYNGREWRNLSGRMNFPDGGETGELRVRVGEQDVELSFESGAASTDAYVANLALLGFGLRSDVGAGENQGRELRHDFVVLAHERLALREKAGRSIGRTSLLASRIRAERYALAVWIDTERNPAPIQAVGGFLPEPD